MGIELSMEVKDIIQRMVETVKRYHLEMMNTLVLFDTLLLNRLFATAVEVSSESTLEEIVSEVRKLIKSTAGGYADGRKLIRHFRSGCTG